MDEETTGKELVLTSPSNEAVSKRSKPSLVQVGSRLVTSDGRFHPELAARHILTTARDKWVTVPELARMTGSGNTIDGKKRVRKNMFRVFTHVLAFGEFLVYETIGPRQRINAVKLLDPKSQQDIQAAEPQVQKMRQRHQLSAEKYVRAMQIIELKRNMELPSTIG